MSDVQPPNPYQATTLETSNPMPAMSAHRTYGGIGRLAYFGLSFLAGIVYNVARALEETITVPELLRTALMFIFKVTLIILKGKFVSFLHAQVGNNNN